MSYPIFFAALVFAFAILVLGCDTNVSAWLLERVPFFIPSQIALPLLVYVYFKLAGGRPSAALLDETTADSIARVRENDGGAKHGDGRGRSDADENRDSNSKATDAGSSWNDSGPAACDSRGDEIVVRRNCLERADASTTRAIGSTQPVRSHYPNDAKNGRRRCEFLLNGENLFEAVQVAQPTEKFGRRNCDTRIASPPPPAPPSPPTEKNAAEKEKHAALSYSWVFGDDVFDAVTRPLPRVESSLLPDRVNRPALRSFRRERASPNKSVVRFGNHNDRKAYVRRRAKNDVQPSGADKLKPIAIIDPLTLPAKSNGLEGAVVEARTRSYSSAANTESTNAYLPFDIGDYRRPLRHSVESHFTPTLDRPSPSTRPPAPPPPPPHSRVVRAENSPATITGSIAEHEFGRQKACADAKRLQLRRTTVGLLHCAPKSGAENEAACIVHGDDANRPKQTADSFGPERTLYWISVPLVAAPPTRVSVCEVGCLGRRSETL